MGVSGLMSEIEVLMLHTLHSRAEVVKIAVDDHRGMVTIHCEGHGVKFGVLQVVLGTLGVGWAKLKRSE